jgi:tetratricopeptide (TPR) repeat protein
LSKFVERNRLAVTLGCLAVVGVLGGAAMALWQGRIARLERDRAKLEGEKAQRVAGFLAGLLGAGDVTWSSPTRIAMTNPTLAQALDSAARRLPRELGDEPLIRAALHRTIGRSFLVSGRAAEARAQLDSALAIHTRLLGADDLEVGQDMHYLAYLLVGSQPDSGERLVNNALALYERHRPDTIADYPPLLYDLAYYRSGQGRFAEAESLYKRAVEFERQRPEPRRAFLALANGALGLNYWNRGDFQSAVALMRQGVAMFDSLPAADLSEHASALFTLATALNSSGRARESLPYLERAQPIYVRVFGPNAPVLMQIGIAMADAYAARGDTVRSDSVARAALALGDRLPPGSEGTRFQAEWTYARMLRAQRRFDEAERIGRRQYALAQRSVTNVPYFWADATFMLGAILVDRGKLGEAEPLMLDSYRTGRDKLGATHVRTQRVLPGLVMIYEGLGRTADAARYRGLMPDTMRVRFDSIRAGGR